MTLEQYNLLTFEELEFLYVVINQLQPPVMPYSLDHSLFIAIKHKFLIDRLIASEKFVALEYRKFYVDLLEKLK